MSKKWKEVFGTGTRQSPQLDLSPVDELADSLIEWTTTEPTDTDIVIETSIDNGETWQEATNGESIPNLPDNLEDVELLVRQNLSTSDSTVTPRLDYLKVRVNTIKYTADLVGNGIANTYY